MVCNTIRSVAVINEQITSDFFVHGLKGCINYEPYIVILFIVLTPTGKYRHDV